MRKKNITPRMVNNKFFKKEEDTKEIIPRTIYQIWIKKTPESEIPPQTQKFIGDVRVWCHSHNYNHVLIDENSDIYKECVDQSKFCRREIEKHNSTFCGALSDYIRLYVIDKFGGIYLDTDVQIISDFNGFLVNEFFIGNEPKEHGYNNFFRKFDVGVFGSVYNNKIFQRIMYFLDEILTDEYYNHINITEFLNERNYSTIHYINDLWVALPEIMPFIIQEIEKKKIIYIENKMELIQNDNIFEVLNPRFLSRGGIYTDHQYHNTWF